MRENTTTGVGSKPGVDASGVTTTTGIDVPDSMKYLAEINHLRAELAAAQAEVERLRGIIRKVEWCVTVFGLQPRDTNQQCPICANAKCEEHDEECPFYQWEGGAQ